MLAVSDLAIDLLILPANDRLPVRNIWWAIPDNSDPLVLTVALIPFAISLLTAPVNDRDAAIPLAVVLLTEPVDESEPTSARLVVLVVFPLEVRLAVIPLAVCFVLLPDIDTEALKLRCDDLGSVPVNERLPVTTLPTLLPAVPIKLTLAVSRCPMLLAIDPVKLKLADSPLAIRRLILPLNDTVPLSALPTTRVEAPTKLSEPVSVRKWAEPFVMLPTKLSVAVKAVLVIFRDTLPANEMEAVRRCAIDLVMEPLNDRAAANGRPICLAIAPVNETVALGKPLVMALVWLPENDKLAVPSTPLAVAFVVLPENDAAPDIPLFVCLVCDPVNESMAVNIWE